MMQVISAVKKCTKCGIKKPFSDFSKNSLRKIGITPSCLECRRAANKKYPDKRRNRPDRIKRSYGITFEEVVRTLDKQYGLCANIACGREISLEVLGGANRAVIDHCHETGRFRALLCNDCNLTLGKIEKDKGKILGLLDYLNKHKN